MNCLETFKRLHLCLMPEVYPLARNLATNWASCCKPHQIIRQESGAIWWFCWSAQKSRFPYHTWPIFWILKIQYGDTAVAWARDEDGFTKISKDKWAFLFSHIFPKAIYVWGGTLLVYAFVCLSVCLWVCLSAFSSQIQADHIIRLVMLSFFICTFNCTSSTAQGGGGSFRIGNL